MSTASIGIDIGGTKIAIGRVRDGRIEQRLVLRIVEYDDWPAARQAIIEGIAVCRQDALGIGIAAPGPLDCERGVIDSPETLPLLSGRELRQDLAEACAQPVGFVHDATAALLAEVAHGAGRGADSVVMLTLGTGVGGGVWQHGNVVQGAGGFAPEIGHLPVGGGPACYCGADGCLENRCSGTAFDRDAQSIGLDDSRALFDAMRAGDERARKLIDDAAQALARGIRSIVHCYAPQRILIGGGQGASEFAAITARVDEELATLPMAPRPELRVAEMGNEAGMIGAAGLLLES